MVAFGSMHISKIKVLVNMAVLSTLLLLTLPTMVSANRISGFLSVDGVGTVVNQKTDLSIELQYDEPQQLQVGDIIHIEFSNDF